MNSIEQCIIEIASHEQELKMTLRKLSERQLQIQQCKVQEENKTENKTVLKQLKKANASLTQELKECKTNLDETSRALGEATSSRDSCLIALQTK
ncbi:hypothetical protein Tco_0301413 [Tanacetum coccineum]